MKEIRERSVIVRDLLHSGKIGLAGGMYDLSMGKVAFYAD